MQPARTTTLQHQLFPAADTYTLYEQPLNERMRSLLRLEYLFQAIAQSMSRESPWDARNAIASMIDVTDQLARADIKGELIKEVERHATIVGSLRNNPGVNQTTLELTLARLEPLLTLLKSNACQPGAKLRQSDLITQVRQRLAIPGGVCSFDLPGFHHWLNRTPERRTGQMNDWMEDLRIIEDAVHITLKLVRESAVPHKVAAVNGFYQQNLDTSAACQIVRVIVADGDEVFPEISGGKHRFTVRFLRYTEQCARPQQTADTIPFELQLCGL